MRQVTPASCYYKNIIRLYHCLNEYRADKHIDEHTHDIVGHRNERASGYRWVYFQFLEDDWHHSAEYRGKQHHSKQRDGDCQRGNHGFL